ncbi:hypothetical protein CK503_13890 [Aliifodinibius salipaludis]|uniref:Uncharacterized protein n=1 Tax=Fodinibius salipaludis TaxID=2032627 RepID=A0A2A2G794_9BACT|nr:hypothetical protein [Aliifodinibius salipaludis]PAU93010.1 hypothetical protein CK503_13890 [Aliifodinibius salipaludis]
MKSLIKSSFFLILLMAVFNIGLTNAYAKDAQASKVTNIEKMDTTTLKCSMQSMPTVSVPSQTSSILSINLMLDECEPKTVKLSNNTVVVVSSDCNITIIQTGKE